MISVSKRLVSVRVDPELLSNVRRSTGAKSDSEAITRALELAADLEESRRFVRRWAGKLGKDAFATREPTRRAPAIEPRRRP